MMRAIAFAALVLVSASLSADQIGAEMLSRVLAIGDAEGIPRSVVFALMAEESGGDAEAVSWMTRDGYRSEGLFQLYTRPDNLGHLLDCHWRGDRRAFRIMDPIDNSRVALAYLSDLHRRFGNWFQALLFYNCGRVIDAPESTRAYAKRIINAR
jgi:soluble lytic murein transglycosylase-like protein